MNPTGEYIAVESVAPLRGLATTPPSTKLDPSYSPSLLNCVVRDGVVRRRGGYQQIGQQLVGRVLALTEFGLLGQNASLVALTSHRQYVYDVATNLFLDRTPGQVSYTITGATTTTFVIAGNHVADFPVGRLIPVVGGANQGVYTVVTAVFGAATTITVSEVHAATVAGAIVIANDFTTGERDLLDYVGVTDIVSHRFIVTNGQQTPRVWDGDPTHFFANWAPVYPGFVTCKTLHVFAEHLFMGWVTTVTDEPLLIAWSAAGDFDEFDASDAGAQLLYSLKSGIKALKLLGDRLAIYSDDAVMTSTFVGLPAVFSFEVVIPEGNRLVCRNSIVSINVGHIYASEENFYLFDGTRGLRVLGDAVYSDYKAIKDFQFLHRSASLNDFSKRTILFAIPDLNGGTLVYTVWYDVFDLSRMVWAREKYRHNPRAFGFFTNHTIALTWEDSQWEPVNMPWEDELGAWAEEAEQLEFPIRCFGSNEGKVYLVTEGVLTDDGIPQEQVYDTMDFSLPEAGQSLLARWAEIEFEASGTEAEVWVSRDLGHTYTLLETFVLSDSYITYRLPCDQMSRTLRVRFRSAEKVFNLRWCRLWCKSGGPR